ncbi:MAG: hypothetical protein ACRC2R_18015 [Xenococcaceae cyanobacterium]
MEAVNKVEIITSTLEVDRVLDLLDKIGVSGYTDSQESRWRLFGYRCQLGKSLNSLVKNGD